MKIPHLPGCYIMNHVPTGRFYVGSTNDLYARYQKQMTSLRLGRSHNPHLQSLYEEDPDFVYEYTVCDSRESAYAMEQADLDRWGSHPLCLNILNNSRLGWTPGTMPEERRRKIGDLAQITHANNKYRQGMRTSDETRQRMSDSMHRYWESRNVDKPCNERVIRERPGARKPKTEETRQRMREASVERSLKLSKPVSVCGVYYPNVRHAAEALGFSERTIRVRILDVRYPDWIYVN